MKQLVYTVFISNNRASFHLWWNKNLLKQSQNIMKMIVGKWEFYLTENPPQNIQKQQPGVPLKILQYLQ